MNDFSELEDLNKLAKDLEEWKNDMRILNFKEQAIHFSGFINGLVWAYRFNDLEIGSIDPLTFDKILIENENQKIAQEKLKEILLKKESFKALICWLATGYIL